MPGIAKRTATERNNLFVPELEARDYPELSLVMLAVIAFVIGTICLLAALAVCGVLSSAFADAFQIKRKDTGDNANETVDTAAELETVRPAEKQTSLPAKAFLIITGFFGIGAAFVLLFIGFSAFHFAAGHLGETLGAFRAHLESQIE
jgi:hypothetical protein